MEKITFVYPSRIMPGTPANSVNQPESLFIVNDLSMNITFYVYLGTILERDKAYSINVDILNDGESLLIGDNPNTSTKSHNVIVTPMNDYVSISEMILSGVKFENEGVYEVKVTLFKGAVEQENRAILDNHSAFILVRKAWENN